MATSTRVKGERVAEASVESSASAVEWPAIAAGALAAVGVSIIISTLASGAGLAWVRPWSFAGASPATFGLAAAIGLIVTQWIASALGGYLTGRLRIKWVGIRTEEIFFRDTAHGFLAWALATLFVAAVLSLVAAGTVAGSGTEATLTPEAAEQARKAAASYSFFTSLSFLIGAFIACVAGALGGYHRDEV